MVDVTYQVLKQAGEISGKPTQDTKTSCANNGFIGGGGNIPQSVSSTIKDIPVVNVPDYPDRNLPRRGPLKVQGPNLQPKQGLAAPAQDVSSSGPI